MIFFQRSWNVEWRSIQEESHGAIFYDLHFKLVCFHLWFIDWCFLKKQIASLISKWHIKVVALDVRLNFVSVDFHISPSNTDRVDVVTPVRSEEFWCIHSKRWNRCPRTSSFVSAGDDFLYLSTNGRVFFSCMVELLEYLDFLSD